jgi:hypothetical protein
MLGCRNESVWYQREPTIAEILSDSMVKAMMRADGVDPEMLERDLRSVAQTIEANSRMPLRSSPPKRGPRGQALNAFKVWVPASAGTNGESGTT